LRLHGLDCFGGAGRQCSLEESLDGSSSGSVPDTHHRARGLGIHAQQGVPNLWYRCACYLEQTPLGSLPLFPLSPLVPSACALLISLCALFPTPVLCFQQLPHSFRKTPGVAYPFRNSSVAPKRKNASLQVLCLPLLRTPCRVSPFPATLTQTPGMGVSPLLHFPPQCFRGSVAIPIYRLLRRVAKTPKWQL